MSAKYKKTVCAKTLTIKLLKDRITMARVCTHQAQTLQNEGQLLLVSGKLA